LSPIENEVARPARRVWSLRFARRRFCAGHVPLPAATTATGRLTPTVPQKQVSLGAFSDKKILPDRVAKFNCRKLW